MSDLNINHRITIVTAFFDIGQEQRKLILNISQI